MQRYCLLILSVLLLASGCGGKSLLHRDSTADKAKAFRAAGQYDLAVAAYTAHMNERLEKANRRETENPYFYYILIGDTYLEAGKPIEAKQAFVTAQQNNVGALYLVDRYKQLADYYVTKNQYDIALELLRTFRDLDPLAFDTYIDELHKESVAQQQELAE